MNRAITIRQDEAAPSAWPTVEGLSDKAAAINAEPVWRRIEHYVARRWTPRSVVWTIEGPGTWAAPILPASIVTVAFWTTDGWSPPHPATPHPLGLEFDANHWQVTAIVGNANDALPGDVAEAFRRLAEYTAADYHSRMDKYPGASRVQHSIGSEIETTISQRPDHMARAIVNSGAADLLRPYRGTP